MSGCTGPSKQASMSATETSVALDSERSSSHSWLRRFAVPASFAMPAVVCIGLFFVYPIIRMVVNTLVLHHPSGLSINLEPFRRVFADQFAREIVYRTLRVAAVTTLVDLVIALPLTLWMRDLSARWRAFLAVLMLSPLLMSVVVRTLGWVVMLGPQGFVDGILARLGVGPLHVMYTETSIVIGLAQVFLGFMVLSVLTSAMKIPDNLIWASANLGASSWQTLRRVVLPLMVPGLVAGMSIVFPLAAGAYVIPALLGGSRNPTLGTQVYTQAIVQLHFDRGAALSVVLFLIIVVVSIGLTVATAQNRRRLNS